jgi:hypothetical protein
MNNIEALAALFTAKDYGSVMTCNKLYKTCLFKDYNIYFPIRRIHEDNYTTYKLFYNSKQIVYTDKKLYYYLQRPTSIMGNSDITKRIDALIAAEEAIAFIDEKLPELENEVRANYVLANLTILNYMIEYKIQDEKLKERLLGNILNICKKKDIFTTLPSKQQYGILLLKRSLLFYSIFTYIYLYIKKYIDVY